MDIKQLKFRLYKRLEAKQGEIYSEIEKASQEIPRDLRGKIGLSSDMSGCPGPRRKDIREACEKASRRVIPLGYLADEVRDIVKESYGDDYDAVITNTCEAALWISFDALCSPPMGKGDNYQSCYIAPYERHLHHQGSYGRPFPPKYKDLFADRGCTSGEMGFLGKRQTNLYTVIVPLDGAKYECHGIKYSPAPLLTKVDPEKSYEKIAKTAACHSTSLAGITSLGFDTPGYGYSEKDTDGTPKMQKLLSQIAKEYNIVYIVDNATGLPFIGSDIRKVGADIMAYSMDKSPGAPICGLIIGKEEVMVPIRRALGMHSSRWGSSCYGKAAYVTNDPGRESLAGAIAAMKVLREKPEVVTRPVDATYEIILEEMKNLDSEISKYLIVTRSHNSSTIEINYENTWSEDRIGFPIFTIDDMYAGTNILMRGLEVMGIIPTIAYDANCYIDPGQGTTDENGQLIEENMRYAVRGLFRVMEIVSKFWNSSD